MGNKKHLETLVSIATILGAIAIPVAIYLGQSLQASTAEKLNRKVGIAQILSDNYMANCQQKIDTANLIEAWFNLDDVDHLGLINYLEQDKANKNCNNSEKIKNKVKDLKKEIISTKESTSALKNYNIAIHYLEGNSELLEKAQSLKDKLNDNTSLNVKIKPLSKKWFQSNGGLSSNQIRYEKLTEVKAAIALQHLLTKVSPSKVFKLQTIRGTTPSYISIFLKE